MVHHVPLPTKSDEDDDEDMVFLALAKAFLEGQQPTLETFLKELDLDVTDEDTARSLSELGLGKGNKTLREKCKYVRMGGRGVHDFQRLWDHHSPYMWEKACGFE